MMSGWSSMRGCCRCGCWRRELGCGPPGAALITGACAATGRPVLAAHTGTWHTLADGREPNWRNLMIQYAVTARFSGLTGFAAALDALS